MPEGFQNDNLLASSDRLVLVLVVRMCTCKRFLIVLYMSLI
jgi:hypothetical protein